LVFGGAGGFVAPTVDVSITGTFAPLTVSASFAPIVEVSITGSFAPLTVSASVEYRSNTARPTVGQTQHNWEAASALQDGSAIGHQDAGARPVGWAAPWRLGQDSRTEVNHPLPEVFTRSQHGWRTDFQQATRVERSTDFAHQEAHRALRLAIGDAYEAAARLRNSTHFRHQDGDRTKRGNVKTEWDQAGPLLRGVFADFQKGTAFFGRTGGRFQDAMRPVPGLSYPPVTPPPLPGFTCYDPNGELLFELPLSADGHLLFFCGDGSYPPAPPPPPGETIVVPVQRAYIVINNVNLRRVSDNAVVPTLLMSLSIDFQSWTWSFSASLPAAAQSLVEPTSGPVELKALINGTEYRVLAESLARERVFGQTGIRVTGRGKNAVLDAPYAAVQTFTNEGARTAQQLMGDVLTLNGVPLGWSIDWGLEDWLVPAGVFSHQGTYISALNAIAQAAGGYIQPHPNTQTFRVRHKYPEAPWDWATVTPDFELPASVAVRESLAWVKKPDYNRVYVSGQGAGVLARVTRGGTAGDIEAPMVVDALITVAAAGRQRGLAILGDTGAQRELGLRLPVLSTTGVIEPGKFVEYVEGAQSQIGLVRSTDVQVENGQVWQNLSLETHDA